MSHQQAAAIFPAIGYAIGALCILVGVFSKKATRVLWIIVGSGIVGGAGYAALYINGHIHH